MMCGQPRYGVSFVAVLDVMFVPRCGIRIIQNHLQPLGL
jgi:hypothetical protein